MLRRIMERIYDAGFARHRFSIRTKIFVGCLSLTFVTILVGVLSQTAQTTLSKNTLRIYDDSSQSMNNIRIAQAIVLEVSRDLAWDRNDNVIFAEKLQSAIDALDLAQERALSVEGDRSAKMAMRSVADLQAQFEQESRQPTRSQFRDVEQALDVAVGFYAADGFRLRSAAEALAFRTQVQIIAAMLGSLVAAIIITLVLSRAIVPSIRRAVGVATSIASGRLDNAIDRHGRSETGILLGALAVMQESIADKLACIETLMARQASGHASEIAVQHARFETALDHMTIGLRMFGADDRLLVQNKRFVEMFGADPVDFCLTSQAADAPNDMPEGCVESKHYRCTLEDGRIIAIAEEAMPDGGRVVTYDDITEQQRAEAKLSHMVRHDALTGLPNRVLFHELMQQLTGASPPCAFSVVCLDLDHFKTVNDTLGHPVGDALLCDTATRLTAAVAPSDTVVRLGGDEFAIIQRSPAGGQAATALADLLIAALGQPFQIQGHLISVSASIGIVSTSGGTEAPDVLLKNADLALYAAKADGRGIYRVFQPEMDERTQSRRTMEIDLRRAIAESQFELFYQPIVGAGSGDVVAFEALLRWRHPEQGLVSPADFIPIAEETGLILDIGRWVLYQACRDAVHWPAYVKVAVNVSPLQFRSQSLICDIENALEESGLDATRLDVEITESLMMQRTDLTFSILNEIRALGVGISMDDFGTGYSSLSYLRCFPFDKIKIDRSFVQDLVDCSEGLSIVTAVVQIGHSLRMTVVAEGVETEEQAALLRAAGCEELQGYLFGRPQPALVTMTVLGEEAAARDRGERCRDSELQVA